MNIDSAVRRKLLVDASLILMVLLMACGPIYLVAHAPHASEVVPTPGASLAPTLADSTDRLTPRDFAQLAQTRWLGLESYVSEAGASCLRQGNQVTLTLKKPGGEQAIARRVARWLGGGMSVRVYGPGKNTKRIGRSIGPPNPVYPWNTEEELL